MEGLEERIKSQEGRAEELQKEGKYIEALDIYEEILNLKKTAYGENHEDYFKTSYKLCDICNLIAMIFLQKEKFDLSFDFLKKAQKLAMNSSSHKAATFNNLACYFRKTNKLRTSLRCLENALELELKLSSPKGLADTHLNLCAVLSQLGKHDEALEHVLMSVIYLQDELFNQKDPSQDRLSVLAIAYHNMGVELEYLKRKEEAILTYKKAVDFGMLRLGPQNALVENLKNVLASAEDSASVKKQKRKPETRQKLQRIRQTYSEATSAKRKFGSRQRD